MKIDRTLCGLVGTALSATGASLSVTELQAIISIVITILGFVISILIPLGIKLYKKIKAAVADGKVTVDEVEDITKTGKEIVDKTESFIKEVSENKSEGDNKKC